MVAFKLLVSSNLGKDMIDGTFTLILVAGNLN